MVTDTGEKFSGTSSAGEGFFSEDIMPARGTSTTRGKTSIPATLLRSDEHAQHIWEKAHNNAVETYGEGGRAYRVAYAALKHVYEKRGDKWVRKAEKAA